MENDLSLKLAKKRYYEIEAFIERMKNSIHSKELNDYFVNLIVYWIRGAIYIKDYKGLFDYEIFIEDSPSLQSIKMQKLLNFICMNIDKNKESVIKWNH